MKKTIERLPILVWAIFALPLFTIAQNVGIKTTSPNAALDINGDIILRGSSLTFLNGENNNINTTGSRYSNYTITGPTTVFNITGLNGGIDGRIVTLYNSTGFLMTLKHNSPQSIAANTIHTGTGIDFVLSSYSSVTLKYMTFDNKWHIDASHNSWNPGGGTNTSGWASSNDANGDPSYRATFPDAFDRIVFINSPPMLSAVSGGYHSGGGLTITNSLFGGEPFADFLTMDGTAIQARRRDLNSPVLQESESNLLLNVFGGNVGIQRVFPNATLSVGRGTGVDGTAAFFGTTHVSHFNYSGSEDTYIRGGKDNSKIILGDYTGSAVGIGTATTAGYKLAVNGNIRCKEVVVETGWADYVFDEKYTLVPLAIVEQYIAANKHLPGIPSAKEIQTNGLKVAEVQTKMMEKIEELTLYIIELEKRLKKLEKK